MPHPARRLLLPLLLPLIAACQPPADAMKNTAASETRPRAQQLREQLLAQRELGGGHGPLPMPALKASGVAAVAARLSAQDLPALIELAGDADTTIRTAAVHLLLPWGAAAEAALTTQQQAATARSPRAQALEASLLELQVLRATTPAAAPSASR